jgi:hypothetical protein
MTRSARYIDTDLEPSRTLDEIAPLLSAAGAELSSIACAHWGFDRVNAYR